jgi:patatin-like phospholipase/acyl hydrolase
MSTNEMTADELTKAKDSQSHKKFIKQLRLDDLEKHLLIETTHLNHSKNKSHEIASAIEAFESSDDLK